MSGENLRFVAGESHGEGVSRARCHLLDVVLVLGAGCECRHPPRSGLYRSVDSALDIQLGYLSRNHFLWDIVPVKFVMVVDEDERTALEVDSVVGEVQERCEVETAVGLLVDVHMPVLTEKM